MAAPDLGKLADAIKYLGKPAAFLALMAIISGSIGHWWTSSLSIGTRTSAFWVWFCVCMLVIVLGTIFYLLDASIQYRKDLQSLRAPSRNRATRTGS